MQRAFRISPVPAVLTGSLLFASSAFAHIDLIEPEARAHGTAASGDAEVDMNANQKSGPCGQVTNGRGDRVTAFTPGETITIQVREETPHDSYIRVSIDLDGDDSFPLRPAMSTPAETEEAALAAEEALEGADETLLAVFRESNDTANFVHELEVTLPDEPCDDCTLQVVQFMYNAPNPFYFQCADIVIGDGADAADGGVTPVASGGGPGVTTDGGAGGSANSSAAGTAGAPMGGSASVASSAGAANVESAGSGGSGQMLEDVEPADDEGGCALPSKPGGSAATGLFSLLALALGVLRRRRQS